MLKGDIGYSYVDGLLFQTVRDLGMLPEGVENIDRTLIGVTKEALLYFKQGKTQLPEQIRIFCQKKIIDDANSTRATSRPHGIEQGIKHAQMVLEPGTKLIKGWGYFLIERGADFQPDASVNPHNYVDLYLYREGE